MTATETAVVTAPPTPEPVREPTQLRRFSGSPRLRYAAIVLAGYVIALVLFGFIAWLKDAEPFSMFRTMIDTTLLNSSSLQQTVLRAVPIALAALAVTIPARAGLVNVGGEGQLIIGAVVATGVGVAIGDDVPGIVSWTAMCLGGALGGAIWAGLSALMRTVLGANEAVTTLLLNFIATDVMLYLLYEPWKDPDGSGQPQSRPLPKDAILPKLFGSDINLGVFIALAAVGLVWFLLTKTTWGFALRVVGGNSEAARRSGMNVNRLLLSSMFVGGAIAGLGGALNFAGVDAQLHPSATLTYGYVAFLASFLGRHKPLQVFGAAVLFSAIALSGNGLQINDNLDGAIVDILLALIVAVPLVLVKFRRRA